ncbi:MAG: PQQ-dependent sugar dehydrogenase, partial [Limnothrix sp.]
MKFTASIIAVLLGGVAVAGCAPQISLDDPSSLISPEATDLKTDSVQLTPVVNGLEHPWGMAWLPNGDILITERPGRLRIVRDGKLDPQAIAGVSAV